MLMVAAKPVTFAWPFYPASLRETLDSTAGRAPPRTTRGEVDPWDERPPS